MSKPKKTVEDWLETDSPLVVSNEERRRIAMELRSLADGNMPLNFFDVLAEKLGFDGIIYGEDVYRKLAELIDRPLCDPLFYYEDEERAWEDAEPSDEEGANFCQCGNCGERLHWIWGEKLPNYCHSCGAEVER